MNMQRPYVPGATRPGMRRPGQIVTRAMLFEEVWNYRFTPKSNLIDVHVGRLRRKLEAGGEPPLIHSVRGTGFTLTPDG